MSPSMLYRSAAAFAFLIAASATAEVIDLPGEQQPDMRQNLKPEDEALFAGVGKVICDDGDTSHEATATIIGDRSTAITVAHFNMVEDSDRIIKEYSYDDCLFTINYVEDRERISYTSQILSPLRGADSQGLRRSRYGDWLIFSLDQQNPLPTAITPITVHPISVASISQRGTYLVGYAGDMRDTERRFISSDCKAKAFRTSARMLEHLCDTGPGTSGALLLTDFDGVPHAIGIHVASGVGNHNVAIPLHIEIQAALRARGVNFSMRYRELNNR